MADYATWHKSMSEKHAPSLPTTAESIKAQGGKVAGEGPNWMEKSKQFLQNTKNRIFNIFARFNKPKAQVEKVKKIGVTNLEMLAKAPVLEALTAQAPVAVVDELVAKTPVRLVENFGGDEPPKEPEKSEDEKPEKEVEVVDKIKNILAFDPNDWDDDPIEPEAEVVEQPGALMLHPTHSNAAMRQAWEMAQQRDQQRMKNDFLRSKTLQDLDNENKFTEKLQEKIEQEALAKAFSERFTGLQQEVSQPGFRDANSPEKEAKYFLVRYLSRSDIDGAEALAFLLQPNAVKEVITGSRNFWDEGDIEATTNLIAELTGPVTEFGKTQQNLKMQEQQLQNEVLSAKLAEHKSESLSDLSEEVGKYMTELEKNDLIDYFDYPTQIVLPEAGNLANKDNIYELAQQMFKSGRYDPGFLAEIIRDKPFSDMKEIMDKPDDKFYQNTERRVVELLKRESLYKPEHGPSADGNRIRNKNLTATAMGMLKIFSQKFVPLSAFETDIK